MALFVVIETYCVYLKMHTYLERVYGLMFDIKTLLWKLSNTSLEIEKDFFAII